ncbi:MAG: serine protease, partial [Methyloceanibacter sp.]
MLSRTRDAYATLLFAAALCLALLQSNTPATAKGPESLAGVAEGLQETVVNISTTQNLEDEDNDPPGRKAPGSSPFDELFDDFFSEEGADGSPRKVSSLGAGFVIDPS